MPSDEKRDSKDADPARRPSERHEEVERKKKKRPKPPLPRTEREIDAPDRVTLLMLGVMCFMTLVLWGFARGGCNYHPPRETRRPRVVKTEELARDPKDAALEMQQRFIQYDFDGALELSADAAEKDVKKRKDECVGKVKECAEKKKANERTATTAVLLERDMGAATVRATSLTPPSGKQANILRLERRGPIWKVISLAPDDGSFQPKQGMNMELQPGSVPVVPEMIPPKTGDLPPPAPKPEKAKTTTASKPKAPLGAPAAPPAAAPPAPPPVAPAPAPAKP